MKQIRNICMYLLFTGSLIFTSCHKEYFQTDKLSDEMEFQTGLVAPLVYGSMVMEDIVAKFDSTGYVGTLEDGLIYLAYSDTLVEVMLDSLDLLFNEFYQETYFSPEIGNDPIYIGSAVGDTIHFLKTSYFSFQMEGENRLDSIIFKGGELQTEVTSTFQHTGFLTISSNYIRDPGGDPYSSTIEIDDPSGNFTWSDNQDLDGYFLKTDTQGDSVIFRLDYDLAIINSGNPVFPGDYCEILQSFLDLGFYGIYGFIDLQDVVADSGEVDIPIYADVPELSNLKLADPRINIFTENSMGVPFELTLDSVTATAEDLSSVTLEFYEGHPFVIPAPTIDMIGTTAYGEFHINNQTSNLQDLMNIAPYTLSYKAHGEIGQENQYHYLLDTSRFMAEAEFLLPLDLSFTEYTLADTMEFEPGDGEIDTALVKDVVVKVSTVNELPVELGLQIYLLDESYMVLDSVFDGQPVFLSASEVDGQGRLLNASDDTNSISFSSEKLGKLEDTHYMQVEARMVTAGSGNQYVKFYSDYSLDFEISVHGNFMVNTREL
jgi:hypothetical protein